MRVLVTSATLDADKFANFFGGVAVFRCGLRLVSSRRQCSQSVAQDPWPYVSGRGVRGVRSVGGAQVIL